MKNNSKFKIVILAALMAVGSVFFVTSCGNDDDDQPTPDPVPDNENVDISINFMPKINGQELSFDKRFDHASNEQIEIATMMFFVSDVYAMKASGDKELICEIELIDFDPNTNTYNVSANGQIPPGDYTGIELGSGVKQSLNNTDPSEFDLDHPLNTTTGMYWTWATNYIFHKFEGRVFSSQPDTLTSWFFHTGLDELYREKITIDRDFTVSGDAVEVGVIFNIDKVLDSDYQMDLWSRGQSHTTDAKEIATEVVDNTVNAFE